MKKHLHIITLVGAALLTSCNLFIEDEQEELTHGLDLNKKTVYTGDGWSEPKTEQGDGYTITYQYYDNVKLLDDEALSYVVDIDVEETFGCVGIINFREDTPERLLPRIGEIVTIRPNDDLPYGYYAEVITAGFDEGYYSIGTCAVDADKVFKSLDGEISSSAMQDVEVAESRPNAVPTTRADDGGDLEISEDDLEPVFDKESEDMLKGSFTIPLKGKIPLKKLKLNTSARKKDKTKGAVVRDDGSIVKWQKSGVDDDGSVVGVSDVEAYIEFKKEESQMKHDFTVNITNQFTHFYVDINDKVHTKGIAHIKGGITYDKSVEKTKSIKTPLKAGPLGVRFIFGGGAAIEASLFGSLNVEFDNTSEVKIKYPMASNLGDIVFANAYQTVSNFMDDKDFLDHYFEVKESSTKVKNGNFEGSFAFTPSLIIGCGLGTKKISACVYGKFKTEVKGKSFGITTSFDHLDISDKPGMDVTENVEIGLRIGLTFNIYEIIKGIQEDAVDISKIGIKAYKLLVKKLKEKDVLEEDFPDDMESLTEFIKCCEETIAKQDETVSAKLKDVPLDINIPDIPFFKKSKSLDPQPWMPVMKKFSYKRTSTTSAGSTYYVSWLYSAKGILPSIGLGPYYPCVYVDGGKDDPATGTYYPTGYDEAPPIGKDTYIEHYGTGISVPGLTAGKSYNVYPALSTGPGKDALFYDEVQVLTPSLPTVTIKSVDHYESYQTTVMQMMGYYGYLIEAKIAVLGAAKVHEWTVVFGLPDSKGEVHLYEKRIADNKVKETKSHPIKYDIIYHKPGFETTMYGEYHVIESAPGRDLHTTRMDINPYPFIGAWSAFNFSRGTSSAAHQPGLSAQQTAEIDRILSGSNADADLPLVFIDGELATPVAVTQNGITKPIAPRVLTSE